MALDTLLLAFAVLCIGAWLALYAHKNVPDIFGKKDAPEQIIVTKINALTGEISYRLNGEKYIAQAYMIADGDTFKLANGVSISRSGHLIDLKYGTHTQRVSLQQPKYN